MKKYDPDIAPDPVAWLAMSEGQRIGIVEKYHRAVRAKVPRPKAHVSSMLM